MMQKRPADRVATAAEVVELLRPWVDSASSSTQRAIGDLAKVEHEQVFHDASLADTKPVALEPRETDDLAKTVSPPSGTSLERMTSIMVGLVIAAALAAIYLVLFR